MKYLLCAGFDPHWLSSLSFYLSLNCSYFSALAFPWLYFYFHCYGCHLTLLYSLQIWTSLNECRHTSFYCASFCYTSQTLVFTKQRQDPLPTKRLIQLWYFFAVVWKETCSISGVCLYFHVCFWLMIWLLYSWILPLP